MGNRCSGASRQSENDKKINRELAEEKKRMANEVKLLLLGAGESGKSTIAKQMKILHLNGFTPDERLAYRSAICSNVLSSLRNLMNACRELHIEVSPEAQSAYERLAAAIPEYIKEAYAPDIKIIWRDRGIQEAYTRRHEFQLNDSAKYYLDDIDRLARSDYVPEVQDVLRSRVQTTGIIETDFNVEKTLFRMIDVGGQRSERKKWMHCFQDVTAVIFCVALSEYDLRLYEDNTVNRMHESLRVWAEICNSKWFTDTAMILFLNKRDLFEQKIQQTDLNVCFDDYKAGKDYDAAIEFITNKFLSQNENPSKQVYVHCTTATDTRNIEVVFGAVKDIILQKLIAHTM